MKRFALALSAIVVGLVVSSCAVGIRQAATEITATSATLNGQVLSTTGGPGSWYIRYGPASFSTEARTIDFVTNESEPVSERIDGLVPGTTYHFAVCAEDSENPGNPFCSPDQTFTTDSDPTRDSVLTPVYSRACFPVQFDEPVCIESGLSAVSEPLGGASGHVFIYHPLFSHAYAYGGEVTCLEVTGSRAVIGGETDLLLGGVFHYGGFRVTVVDGGGPGSRLDTIVDELLEIPPTDCSSATAPASAVVLEGDIVVIDATSSPTTEHGT